MDYAIAVPVSPRWKERNDRESASVKIGFFFKYRDSRSLHYLAMAEHLLASVRQVMPGVKVYQLTDQHSPALHGIDEVDRCSDDVPMAVLRMRLQGDCSGEWLFVDPDIIVQKDVRPVFDDQFDIALTDRIGTSMEGTPYAAAMPYNLGVAFSRSPAFWQEAEAHLQHLPPALQEWEGDQRVICAMVRQKLGGSIKILSGQIYNYPPNTPNEDVSHAAIVHYKGNRKGWMNNSRRT